MMSILAKLSLDFSETNNEMQLFLKQISSAYSPLGPKLSESVDEAKVAIGKFTTSWREITQYVRSFI